MSDLTDAEFAELDELLANPPAPLQALDVVMLDGYLCGVLVQPERIEVAQWLTPVFAYDGQDMPAGVLETVDATWRDRTQALIERRHAALRRAIAEDGWFHPFVFEMEDEAQDAAPAPDADATATPEAPADQADADETSFDALIASLPPISRPLAPWVAGFELALQNFPALSESAEAPTMNTIARLYRHLPAETNEERELADTMQRNLPLQSLDDAIEDLVSAVVELSDLTERQRYKVDTVRREAPKVGRNDPCPCGSGRKYKQCHGAG